MIKRVRRRDRIRECARDHLERAATVAVSLQTVRIGRLYRNEYNLYPKHRGAVTFSVPPP